MAPTYGKVFTQVADNFETGLMLLDEDLKVVSMNPWLADRVRFDVPASFGQHVGRVFDLEMDSRFILACQQVVTLGTPAMLSNRLNPIL